MPLMRLDTYLFNSADLGRAAEALPAEEATSWLHALASRYLRPSNMSIEQVPSPVPNGRIRTQWQNDPYSYGSYTYIPCAKYSGDGLPATPLDLKEFSVPAWKGALGFAGEHTHMDRYASVHGAYESGLREAVRVDIALKMRSS